MTIQGDMVEAKFKSLRRKGEPVSLTCDGNAHLHAEEGKYMSHSAHFASTLRKPDLVANVGMHPEPAFETSAGTFVQDDYIATTTTVTIGVAVDFPRRLYLHASR